MLEQLKRTKSSKNIKKPQQKITVEHIFSDSDSDDEETSEDEYIIKRVRKTPNNVKVSPTPCTSPKVQFREVLPKNPTQPSQSVRDAPKKTQQRYTDFISFC